MFNEDLVRAYLRCIDEDLGVDLSAGDIVELFRYSMCRVLSLDTVSAAPYLVEFSDRVEGVLREYVGDIPESLMGRQRRLEGYVQLIVMSVDCAARKSV